MTASLKTVCRAALLAGLTALMPIAASPSALAERADLDATALLKGQPTGLVENHWFLPGKDAQPAKQEFTGTLVLEEMEMGTNPATFTSRKVLGKDPKIFPAARLSFFTYKGDLVPVTQDVIRIGSTPSGRSFWDIIVQPGQVWSEPGDDGWSRAAFPFSLVHSVEGETHNGIATFLYKGSKVSKLRFQIVQQTAPYYVVDYFAAWGAAPAALKPTKPANLAQLKAVYEADLAARVPVKSWDDLAAKVGADKLKGFDSAMKPEEILTSGLFDGETLYLKECKSAAGPLPYCDRQRFGVWSATKAAATATALLHLGQKYGPEVYRAKIVDYVKPTAHADDWKDVTFIDALDMATGIGNGSDKRDPNNISDGYLDNTYPAWYEARSVQAKLKALFRDGKKYPWGPGEVARYRDEDMFVLGVAMDGYLKSKEGRKADLWSMLENEVYRPIGINYAPINRTVEGDGRSADKPGQPLMAYGYYPTLGDLAKIARLYQNRGKQGDRQLLDAAKVDELIYGTKERGLPTGDKTKYGETRYLMAYWQAQYQSPEGCHLYMPQMDGWGGNYIVLMPGNYTGIRLAKNWTWEEAVSDTTGMMEVANRLTKFCP